MGILKSAEVNKPHGVYPIGILKSVVVALAALMIPTFLFTSPAQADYTCSNGKAFSVTSGTHSPWNDHFCAGKEDYLIGNDGFNNRFDDMFDMFDGFQELIDAMGRLTTDAERKAFIAKLKATQQRADGFQGIGDAMRRAKADAERKAFIAKLKAAQQRAKGFQGIGDAMRRAKASAERKAEEARLRVLAKSRGKGALGKEKTMRDLNSAREQEFKLTDQIKQFRKEVTRLLSQPDSDYNRKRIEMVRGRIQSSQAELAAVTNKIRSLTGAQTHQSMAGFPPDADLLYRLKKVSWWTKASLSHSDQSKSDLGGTSTGGNVMVGGSLRLSPNSGIGLGVGFTNGTAKSGGRKTTSDGINLMAGGFWGRKSTVLFDVSTAYEFSRKKGKNSGVSDTYNVHNLGFGFGVNKAYNFNRLWRAEGRLGYSASWTIREASTDSAAVRQARATNNFGRATLSGRLLRKFESGNGHLFADGKIIAVTHDDSSANQDKKPFEGEIGAGLRTKLGGAAALTARGFYGGIGRKAKQSYGGSLNLGFDF